MRLTPIQTVLPHIAMILNADGHVLGDYYSHFAAMGSRGPVGTVGFLSPYQGHGTDSEGNAEPRSG